METGLVSIEIVARIHTIPLDIQAIRRNYFVDRELKPEELLRILKDNGMRARFKTVKTIDEMARYPAPIIVMGKGDVFHVFLGKREDKIGIFDCAAKQPREVTAEEFRDIWTGRVIVLYPRFTKTEFFLNFKWLFKEFLRHRSVFSSVISASFFIQLFGLVTPLFIQVIIDKVLAHHALTTLEVVAGAFFTVLIFDTILNLMRNYLLYHTANKIDASIGSKVYRHLLSLPFNYFEVRKVGTIIARVRELENLRQFMTNISLTVLLDVFFSIIFVVIMTLYSPRLTLIVMGFVVAIGLISLIATPLINVRLNDKFQKGAANQSFLVESITGIQTVKALAIEGKMVKEWEKNLGQSVRKSNKTVL